MAGYIGSKSSVTQVDGYTRDETDALVPTSIDDNGNATALTIDSSENVLVGKTSSSTTTAGNELRAGGLAAFTRSGSYSLNLNRLASDGDIAVFQKDGTTVGSIGAHSSGTYLGTADTGIYFNGGNDSIDPYNPSVPINRDNAISLGAGSRRFKDLYLSGGVYLGGTGAANKLDDYEEGSWTPSMSGMGNASFSQQFGSYTKIGNLAHVTGKIAWSGATGTSSVHITGIPFTGADASDHLLRNSAWPQGDYVNINTLIDRNGHFRIAGNTLFGVIDNTSGSTIAMQCGTHVASSGEFNFYLVYRTT